MQLIKENVFLLTRIDYRDNDIIATFISKDSGKLQAFVRQGKKLNKASSFNFNPADELELSYEHKENKNFIQIESITPVYRQNESLLSYKRFIWQSYLLELISKVTSENSPAESLFDILIELKSFRQDSFEGELVFIGWSLNKIINFCGCSIQYDSCHNCFKNSYFADEMGKAHFRKEKYYLNIEDGSLFCSNCNNLETRGKRIISPALIKLLWLFDQNENYYNIPQTVPTETWKEFISIVNSYLLNYYKIRIRSLGLFQSILKV